MKDPNLPDNCQGNDPSYPWNQVDVEPCPECGSENIEEEGDKWEGHVLCLDCDYVIASWDNIPEPDEDFLYDNY